MSEQKAQNMKQVLEILEKNTEGKRLIRYMEDQKVLEVSSRHFFEQVQEEALMLEAQGLAGKQVGVIGRNSWRWLVSFCGIFQAGAVAVLLDWESDPETIGKLAVRAELAAICFDDSVENKIREARLPKSAKMISIEKKKEKSSREEKTLLKPEQKGEDLACIFFTSGTTGESKAVMMSQQGLAASICSKVNDKPFQALLGVLPFHHLSGFVAVLNAMYLGAEVCLGTDLKYFYRYLEQMKPDYVCVVPSMLQLLARKLKKGGENGRLLGWNLHMIHCGGAAFCSEFLQLFHDRKITVVQGYGASEAGGIGFMWEMSPERPDTIGKPPAEMEVKIENGEIFLRSASVMMGYYKDPEATREVLCDGWYATGDLARQDEEGYLYLTGRKKNLIILSNGENVSPEEIETKLYACREICEVMVGVEKQMITAVIFPYLPQGSTEEETERIRCRIRKAIETYNMEVPLYRQVQDVRFIEQPFAKTTGGKLLRRSMTGGNEGDR
ncbi:MAG: AMP-binding protein [Blautia sp.]